MKLGHNDPLFDGVWNVMNVYPYVDLVIIQEQTLRSPIFYQGGL